MKPSPDRMMQIVEVVNVCQQRMRDDITATLARAGIKLEGGSVETRIVDAKTGAIVTEWRGFTVDV